VGKNQFAAKWGLSLDAEGAAISDKIPQSFGLKSFGLYLFIYQCVVRLMDIR